MYHGIRRGTTVDTTGLRVTPEQSAEVLAQFLD